MTTIPVSTAPAVSDYLVSAIQAQTQTDPLDILVKLGETGTDNPPDVITVGQIHRVVTFAAFVGSGGAGFLDEGYDLTITAWTWVGSGDVDGENTVSSALNARAWQLVSYIETAVRLDPSFGNLVNEGVPVVALSSGPVWTKDPVGMVVQVEVTVHIEATI